MGRNAQRRHAKAVRRKNLLAERRRQGMAESKRTLAENVRRASAAPLHSCLLQNEMFESGVGMVILARKTGAHRVALAGFLVDVYCLGVKDALFREIDEAEIETIVDSLGMTAPFEAVDPSYARKLLRDAAAYARSLGLEPHADYAAVEPLFGDVDADACEEEFQFGHEGKPLYLPGPTESPTQIRRRFDLLSRRLGADGFEFREFEDALDALEAQDDEDEDFDLEEDEDLEGAYDPDVAPDPARWLALDEQERLEQVLDYHRRAGITLPNEKIHAVMHATVENQIAMGDELPVRRTVERLMAEGLDRHEAVHAVASVLTARLFDALKDPEAKVFPTDAYSAAVERLTAESWRRDFGDEDEDG
jgi:Domain of unknown function (DUF1841)